MKEKTERAQGKQYLQGSQVSVMQEGERNGILREEAEDMRFVNDRPLVPESTVEALGRLKRKDVNPDYFKGHTELNGDERL